MTSAKLKLAAVAGGLALLGTALIVQRQSNKQLVETNADLEHRLTLAETDLELLRKVAKQNRDESAQFRVQQDELLRLRGLMAKLLRSSASTNVLTVPPLNTAASEASSTPINSVEDRGTETPEDTSVSFIWALSAQQRERFFQLVKLPDDLTPETKVRHLDYLFSRMTNAYSQWEFRSLRREQTRGTGLTALPPLPDEIDRLRGQPADQATLRMNAAYLDLKSGNEGELLVFLREFESGWKIVIDDVPREAPSANGP